MGLEQKRRIKHDQDNVLPARTKELAELSGSAITYEVDRDSFADDLIALNLFDNLAFHRINMAFRLLGNDQFARGAIRDGLKILTEFARRDRVIIPQGNRPSWHRHPRSEGHAHRPADRHPRLRRAVFRRPPIEAHAAREAIPVRHSDSPDAELRSLGDLSPPGRGGRRRRSS